MRTEQFQFDSNPTNNVTYGELVKQRTCYREWTRHGELINGYTE